MSDDALNLSENSERGHLMGPGNAPVTLIEYGDFQCPACGAFYPIGKALIRRFGSQLDFVFKHFPLVSIHPLAMPAAQAAEAAARQGRFWPMHDKLFENQQALSGDDLLRYARELRLDAARFDIDFSHRATWARIERDINQGQQNGVRSTPALFVNGEAYTGEVTEEALARAIEQARARPPLPASQQTR